MGNVVYARGAHAWGECQRCGFRYLLGELRADGYKPNVRVCEACWEPKHPQERIIPATDPQALRRPSPEVSVDSEDGTAAPELSTFLPPP